MFRFEDQNKPTYNFEAEQFSAKTTFNQVEQDNIAYASLLSGNNPIESYQRIMEEYRQQGDSQFVNGLIEQANKDTDLVRRAVIQKTIKDPNLPKDIKLKALQNYYTTGEMDQSLRDTYAEFIAAQYPRTVPDPNAFTSAFFEKELVAEQIDKELNDFGKDLTGGSWQVFADVAPWLAPLLALNPLTLAIPVAASARKGYLANQITQAAQNKDFSFFKDTFNTLFAGEGVESTRQYLKSLPPKEKLEAVKRIRKVIEQLPMMDYERFRYMQSFVEAEDYTMLDRIIDDTIFVMDGVLLAVLGKTAARAKQISPKSPLGTTAAHNPTVGGNLAGSAIVDDSGQVAQALGETHASIIGSLLPKEANELISGLTQEANPELLRIIQGIDENSLEALRIASRNELLYSPELKATVSNKIYEAIRSAKGMVPHLGKSKVNSIEQLGEVGDEVFKGSVIFGKNADEGWNTAEEALEAADLWLKGSKVEGTPTAVKIADKYFIQHSWQHTYNPMDLMLWGEMAIRTPIGKIPGFSWTDDVLTMIARHRIGRSLFAQSAYDKRLVGVAHRAIDRQFSIEKDTLVALNRYLAEAPVRVRQNVDVLLKEGEDLGKTWTLPEVTAKLRAQGLTDKEVEAGIKGYYVYRRIADWQYIISNTAKKAAMEADNVKQFMFGNKAVFAKAVPQQAVSSGKMWNFATNTVDEITKTQLDELYKAGGTVVKLRETIRVGDDIFTQAIAKAGTTANELPDHVLPYIKGWLPRTAENTYFVQRIPLEATVDGIKITDPNKLKEFATTHHAANTKKEAEKSIKELQKEDPFGKYEWRRERTEVSSIIEDAKIHSSNMAHSYSRGANPLPGAENIDPLIGLHRLVKSLARHAAMDDFIKTFQSTWLKKYGDLHGYNFPQTYGEIGSKVNAATLGSEDLRRLKEARSHFDYFESVVMTARYDQRMWQNAMIAISSLAEPISGGVAKAVKDTLKKTMPLDIGRRLATHLLISLNPVAQRVVQSLGQALTLPAINPKLFNPLEFGRWSAQTLAVKWGVNSFRTGTKILGWIPEDHLVAVGSKLAMMKPEEYKQLLIDIKESGLLSSIDQNTIIEGVFTRADVAMTESRLQQTTRQIKSGVKAIPAAGRKVGFDSGEQDNLVMSYLVMRDRLKRMRPDLDTNSRFFKEQVAADTREITFSMNRAGTFQYQNNILAMPLQFIAAPHKALLQLTTSKTLTNAEKVRMAGMYMAMFGGFGTVAATAVKKLREEFGDVLPDEAWVAIEGGLLDWGGNYLISELTGTNSQLALSERFSPIGGKFPIQDFLEGLSDHNIVQLFSGPSWSLLNESSGKIPRAIRDISQLYTTEGVTAENMTDYLLDIVELTAGGTNWMKYRVAENTGYLIATNGIPIDKQATSAEAIAQILGVQTKEQKEAWMLQQKFKDLEKEYDDAGKYIHETMRRRAFELMAQGVPFDEAYNAQVKKFLAYERDPMVQKSIIDASKTWNKRMLQDTGQNIQSLMLNDYYKRSEEENRKLMNYLESSSNPKFQEIAKNLKKITDGEQK